MRSRGLSLGALGLAMLAFPAGALAAAGPPAITSSFTPNSIGTGDTSALSYVITNPNASKLTGIGFTDQLPAGLVVDNPNGTSVGKSCGSGATLSASPGGQAISLTGAGLAADRTDTATVTSGSATVSDATITASDLGSAVTGTGIPAGTYVGTVTAGSSFLLSSSPAVQVNVNATGDATGVTVEPTCVVSAAVTAATAGVYQNSTGTVSSTEGGIGNSDQESLTVIAPPTVTVTAPVNGAKYTEGQQVIAHYSCQEAPNGPGLDDCEGDVPNGSPIDTSSPGQQTFDVIAVSQDGQVTDQTINYTVLPSNQFTVSRTVAESSGRVLFNVTLPGPGKVAAIEHAVIRGQSGQQPVLFGRTSLKVSKAGTDGLAVYLTAQGKKLIQQVHRADHVRRHAKHQVIQVTLTVTYTPTGSTARSLTFKGISITP